MADRTKYTVLFKTRGAARGAVDQNETWEVLGVVDETSASRARRVVAEKHEREGTFVAVPQRSFAPEKLQLERTPRAVAAKK